MQSFGQRISSTCKRTPTRQDCILTFYHDQIHLTILLVDQAAGTVFSTTLTPHHPHLLIEIFGNDLEKLYLYLAENPLKVCARGDIICIDIPLTILASQVVKTFRLPTKKYSLEKEQGSAPPREQDGEEPAQKQVIIDCSQQIVKYNSELVISKIGTIQNDRKWFVNKISNLCLQLSHPIRENQTNTQLSAQIVTYRLAIALNQFHSLSQRYDLTLGFALPQQIHQLKSGGEPNFDNSISVGLFGRRVTSHCLQLKEEKQFEKVILPQSLEVAVRTRGSSSGRTMDSVKICISRNTLNIFDCQQLEGLTDFEPFVPFVYFARSFLHFSLHDPL